MAGSGKASVLPVQPLFSFGVIADVQYANTDDGYNHFKTRQRYYRNSLNLLNEAIETWNNSGTPIDFILQLGDIIDGLNKRHGKSENALQTVMKAFKSSSSPAYHLWGNHDLYNFDQPFLLKSPLNSNPCHVSKDVKSYYDISPRDGYRFIMLNTYELSALGYPEEHPVYKEALALLKSHNCNEELNSPDGLCGLEQRFLKCNGGVTEEQLQWLDTALQSAKENGELVIVSGHSPVYAHSCDVSCLLWNCDKVLDTLHSYPNTVAAYLAGHDHDGGYAVDDHGLHHVTMPGVIETPPGSNAFATVHVCPGNMLVVGCGRVQDVTIPLPPHGKAGHSQ